MLREFTCIMCPQGCDISVELEGKTIKGISGNKCPKGEAYVTQEIENPMRNIATSVLVDGGGLPLASVRLSGVIPKDRIFDVIGLGDGFSIVEVEPPKAWIGRTIADVNLRSRYGLNLIAARRGDKMHTVIDPSYTFSASEHVLVLGSLDDIQKVT